MSEELKPCPFCGGADTTIDRDESDLLCYVRCEDCCARGPMAYRWPVEKATTQLEAEAVAAWNRRTEAPPPPPCDAAALAGTWPGDVDDGFEAMVDEHRHGTKGGNDGKSE